MSDGGRNKVVELFPQQGGGSVLRVELYKVADRIDGVVADLRDELPPEEVQRLGHRLDDLKDVVTFLQALSSA